MSKSNVILVGGGIMGATLGTLLQELEPTWKITLFEKLDEAGQESSNEWNNAGTGHAAYCELNYTSENEDGSIDIDKAVEISEQFLTSLQFWSFLVENNALKEPKEFIRPLPHISFVQEEEDVFFLRNRFNALSQHPLFREMQYTENPEKLAEWVPLMMKDRSKDKPIAGTKMNGGADVNFGSLTRKLVDNLMLKQEVTVNYNHNVTNIRQLPEGTWEVEVHNLKDQTIEHHISDFVFIGAGGGAIPLLQKTNIPESKQIAGFPISGKFLVCKNPEIVEQHHAKVYGRDATTSGPPMTGPHLDRRYIENKNLLLFGPFASFGPKFLVNGSNLDLLKSIQKDNVLTMLFAGVKNLPLVKYSIRQMMLTKSRQMEELRKFVPNAKDEDWDIVVAGKRVQVIKESEQFGKGSIQFGTELVHSHDRTLAALLGESPGASTSVEIMLDVLEKCFPHRYESWKQQINKMIPLFGKNIQKNPKLLRNIQASNNQTLFITKK